MATTEQEFATFWTQEIERGEKYMKKYSTINKWKDWRQSYRGDWDPKLIPVNRTFSLGRSMIPKIYLKSPRVSVTATRPEFINHARVVEAVDNMLIQTLGLKQTMKRAILHSFLSGTAPIKLGFDSEFGFLPQQSVSYDSGTATQISRKERRLIEYNQTIKPGMPWAINILPEDVIIPWGYSDPLSVPWVGHKIYRPLKDVKEDQKYRNTKDLKGTKRASLDIPLKSPFISGYADELYTELIEIRDWKTGEIIVICEEQLLLKDEDALQDKGLPWEFLTFNEDPEYFWGIPDAYILEPQQNELNEIKTQQSRHRKVTLLKFLYSKGALTEDQVAHLLSGEVGPAVGVDAEALQNAIITLQPHMPPELWTEARAVLADMQESLGFSENQLGNYVQKGANVSATETAEVAQNVDARQDERRDIVSDTFLNIIKKWNSFIFTLWDQEKIIEVVGPSGMNNWVIYKGTQLNSEYTIKVELDSGFPMTGNAKRQLADGLFKAYNGDPMMDQMKLRQFHLDKYENLTPGILSILRNPQMTPPDMNSLLGAARQPNPMGGGAGGGRGSSAGTNRGGGQKPVNFEDFVKGEPAPGEGK